MRAIAVMVSMLVSLTASEVGAAVDVSGTWNVCLECVDFCFPLPGGPQVWTFTQTGTAFHVDLDGSSFSIDGTIDPDTGEFDGCTIFCLNGIATNSSITATLNADVNFAVTGLRACDPLAPATCDDGEPLTVDTCCNTPIATCAPVSVSCTHDDSPVCIEPTTTTTSTTSPTSSSTTSTTLIDRPVDGVKLLIQRTTSGKDRLAFKTKDPNVAFPPIGSPDDPAVGTPGGARIELFSQNGGHAAIDVPGGVGRPGWTVTDAATDRYRFAEPAAPGGLSAVRKLVLRQGKGLTVDAHTAGLQLDGAQGVVGIRITTGGRRTCALFDGATIRVDRAEKFLAKGAVASSLADCADATLP